MSIVLRGGLRESIESQDFIGGKSLAEAVLGGASVAAPAGADGLNASFHADTTESLMAAIVLSSLQAAEHGATGREMLQRLHEQEGSAVTPQQRAMLCYAAAAVCLQCAAARPHDWRRHTADATKHLQRTLELDPHFAIAHHGLGVAALLENDPRRAFGCFRRALEQLGSVAPTVVRIGLGLCAARVGKFDIAERCFARAAAVDPQDPLAPMGLVLVHSLRREAALATAAAEQMYRLAPRAVAVQKMHDAMFLRCLDAADPIAALASSAELLEGLLAQAREALELERAAGLETATLDAYQLFQEGRLRFAQGDAEAAIGPLERAVEREVRGLVAPYLYLAKAMLAARGPRPALDVALRGVERIRAQALPQSRELSELAATLLAAEDAHESALRLSRQLVEGTGAASATAWACLAWANRLDHAEYMTALRAAIELGTRAGHSAVPYLKANVAALDATQGKHEAVADSAAALGVDLKAIEAGTAAPSAVAVPLVFNLALALEGTQEDRARRLYALLIKAHPHEAAPYYRLAALCDAAGRPEAALRWLALLLEVAPADSADFCACLCYMARLMAATGPAGVRAAYSLLTAHVAATLRAPNESAALVLTSVGSVLLTDAQSSSHIVDKSRTALKYFAAALDRDPNSLTAAHGVACCLAQLGMSVHAATLLERIMTERPNAQAAIQGVTESAFYAFVTTSAHRKALQLFANKSPAKHIRAAVGCCSVLVGQLDRGAALLRALRADYPQDSIVALNALLAIVASVLGAVLASKTLTADAAAALAASLDEAVQLEPLARRAGAAGAAARRICSIVERLNVRGALQRYVRREVAATQEDTQWQADWRDALRQKTEVEAAARARAEAEARELERQRLARVQADALRFEQPDLAPGAGYVVMQPEQGQSFEAAFAPPPEL